MKRENAHADRRGQEGSILVTVTIMSFVMIILGLAFLNMVSNNAVHINSILDRRIDFQMARAGAMWVRAYYHNPELQWGDGRLDFWEDDDIISVYALLDTMPRGKDSQGWATTFSKWAVAEGFADYFGSGNPSYMKVMVADQVTTFADYLYITDFEYDPLIPDTVLKFWGRDTLDGKVHSNDVITMQRSSGTWPVFYETVSSCSSEFRYTPYNPAPQELRFFGSPPYRLNAGRIIFPVIAEEVRAFAQPDHFWDFGPGNQTWIQLNSNYYKLRRTIEPDGPFLPETWEEAPTFALPADQAIFVNGVLRIQCEPGGAGLDGRVTIGAADTVFIMDDIFYAGSDSLGYVPINCDDALGLISETWILVHDSSAYNIVINAAMAALNTSISVQRIYDFGYTNEKGVLQVHGALAQKVRGKVHTSMDGYRGFVTKQYKYDKRFRTNPPPHYFKVSTPVTIWWESSRYYYDDG